MAQIPMSDLKNQLVIVVPIGSVLAYAGTSAPVGWLLCDGSQVSRVTYINLFNVIGTAHGNGNGSSTFHLPDYRGRFLRGLASGSALDPDRASRTAMAVGGNTGDNVGSIQGHAFQTHTHIQNAHTHTYTTTADATLATGHSGGFGTDTGNLQSGTSGSIANTTATNQNATATGANAQATANETRPVNAAVNYIIKF